MASQESSIVNSQETSSQDEILRLPPPDPKALGLNHEDTNGREAQELEMISRSAGIMQLRPKPCRKIQKESTNAAAHTSKAPLANRKRGTSNRTSEEDIDPLRQHFEASLSLVQDVTAELVQQKRIFDGNGRKKFREFFPDFFLSKEPDDLPNNECYSEVPEPIAIRHEPPTTETGNGPHQPCVTPNPKFNNFEGTTTGRTTLDLVLVSSSSGFQSKSPGTSSRSFSTQGSTHAPSFPRVMYDKLPTGTHYGFKSSKSRPEKPTKINNLPATSEDKNQNNKNRKFAGAQFANASYTTQTTSNCDTPTTSKQNFLCRCDLTSEQKGELLRMAKSRKLYADRIFTRSGDFSKRPCPLANIDMLPGDYVSVLSGRALDSEQSSKRNLIELCDPSYVRLHPDMEIPYFKLEGNWIGNFIPRVPLNPNCSVVEIRHGSGYIYCLYAAKEIKRGEQLMWNF